jgi:uncharacterized protein (DUF58 family)
MGLVLVGVLVAVTIALVLTPGIGVLAFVPLAAAVLVGIWVVMSFASHSSPTQEVRGTPKQELLGPGGPDDPDR